MPPVSKKLDCVEGLVGVDVDVDRDANTDVDADAGADGPAWAAGERAESCEDDVSSSGER